jgi:arginase
MNILLLSVPYDSGHYKKRLGLGPDILSTVAEDELKCNGHMVRKEEVFADIPFSTEVTTSFAVIRLIAEQVKIANANGEFPVIFSGNCNAASLGALSGSEDNCGVIWFDCHGDFNTPETTIGGYLDGMSLSIVAGQCWTQLTASVPGFAPVNENRIMLIGARDFDPLERQRLSASAITLITPEMLRQSEDPLKTILPADSIYLHIDLDVLDPSYVKINMYSTEGGLSPEQLIKTVGDIKKKYRIAAVGFTAYDPSLDPHQKVPDIVNSILSVITN